METKQGVWLLPYDPTPSQEDIQVTRRLTESGKMIGIELLDHLIIGDRKFVSLKEKGYL
ncbi:DNA repair protein RadC [Virgibacillus halodenitrificans]|uniref:DNA repair protein RadC n=1 Tax=Virgibacillus halodenitrificans TaxID=1482 RepID=A0ABR7VPC2_VIRHA|nr:DNA repair protein RadC [Virgibacillus halodenitrificans]MYL56319.1 DNA repair protein RadC [Virgibacillus halodenitrificans]